MSGISIADRNKRRAPHFEELDLGKVGEWLEQLRAAGCGSRNIDREKVTGARTDRRELNRMLGKLAPGDVVTVTRIDRLARSADIDAVPKSMKDECHWSARRWS